MRVHLNSSALESERRPSFPGRKALILEPEAAFAAWTPVQNIHVPAGGGLFAVIQSVVECFLGQTGRNGDDLLLYQSNRLWVKVSKQISSPAFRNPM